MRGAGPYGGGRDSYGLDRGAQRARCIDRGRPSRGAWRAEIQRAAAHHGGKWSRSCAASVLSIPIICRRDPADRGVSSPVSRRAPSGVFRHGLSPRSAAGRPVDTDPRRYEAQDVRRYGFHGLSYAYLMEELAHLGDPAAATGRVDPEPSRQRREPRRRAQRKIHRYEHELYAGGWNSNGHALRRSRSWSGWYLARTEQMGAKALIRWSIANRVCLGYPEPAATCKICSNARHGTRARPRRSRCLLPSQEVDRFLCRGARRARHARLCRRHRRRHPPTIRARICEGLGFLGFELDSRAMQRMRP